MLPVKNLLKFGILSFSLTTLRCDDETTDPPPVEQPATSSPSIASVSPNLGAPEGGTGVAIVGTHFDENTRIFIGGVEATGIEHISDTMVLATTPPAVGKKGFVEVRVQNADGGTSSNSRVFSYYSSSFSFTAGASFDSGIPVTGDFNGDGFLDLAMVTEPTPPVESFSSSPKELRVYLGNGDGTFQDPKLLDIGYSAPSILMSGDLDGDGKADLVLVNYCSNTLQILFAQADGSFSLESTQIQNLDLPYWPESVVLGDVDKDGIMDLVVATKSSEDYSKKDIRVYAGRHNRPLVDPLITTTGVEYGKIVLQLADLNGDQTLDLLYTLENTATLTVGLGVGDGTFTWKDALPIGKVNKPIMVSDMNKDGKLDVMIISDELSTYTPTWGTTQIVYLLGKGDGTFDVKPNIVLNLKTSFIAVGDVNGDGAPDLLSLRNESDTSFSVLLGKGDGSFQDVQSFLTTDQVGSSILMGDFNGDGKADIVLPGTYGGHLDIFQNSEM